MMKTFENKRNAWRTPSRSSFRLRISRALHVPASRHANKKREGRHLLPQFQGRSTRQRHDVPDVPENDERVTTYAQNFEDAPRAGVTTRRKQREGRHLRPEFRGRSTRRRHDAWKTARGLPLTSRISRTLHAPASRRVENSERVATSVQNFEDAPRASVTTRRPTDRPTDRPSPFYTKGKDSVADQSLPATPRQPRLGKKNTGP